MGNEGSARNDAQDKHVAVEQEDDIVDETFDQRPVKNHTLSKSRKIMIPDPIKSSDSEDDRAWQASSEALQAHSSQSLCFTCRWSCQMFPQ